MGLDQLIHPLVVHHLPPRLADDERNPRATQVQRHLDLLIAADDCGDRSPGGVHAPRQQEGAAGLDALREHAGRAGAAARERAASGAPLGARRRGVSVRVRGAPLGPRRGDLHERAGLGDREQRAPGRGLGAGVLGHEPGQRGRQLDVGALVERGRLADAAHERVLEYVQYRDCGLVLVVRE